MRIRAYLLLFCGLTALAFQAPEGTADRCDNFFKTPAAEKCACVHATECPMHGVPRAEPGMKCKTYCKTDHCHCLHPCTS